ncbi:MAG: hypothetical protein MUD12_15020 [Spirochaetes bacterium]|jgi:hypothetical protein|nr:hypothetical protein [Spirochaetota bacterium]
MNLLYRITSKFMRSTSRGFELIDRRTADMIKNSFYFFIFVLCVGGIIMGVKWGKNAAQIKSPPLAGTTNEVFDLDISREKDDGSFRNMLESEAINEMKNPAPAKNKYPAKERLEPDLDKGIVEPEKDRKARVGEMDIRDRIAEGEYRPSLADKSDVKQLRRETRPYEGGRETIIKEGGDRIPLLEKKKHDMSMEKEGVDLLEKKTRDKSLDSDVDILEKKKDIKRGPKRQPQPILKDRGIIGN